MPITRQCQLLGLCWSSIYNLPMPENDKDKELMRLINEIHLKYLFYSSRNSRNELRIIGHKIGKGHLRTLMRKMGIEALHQNPRLAKPYPGIRSIPTP